MSGPSTDLDLPAVATPAPPEPWPGQAAGTQPYPAPGGAGWFFDAAPDACLVLDPDDRIVDANAKARVAFGDARENLAGRNLADIADQRFVARIAQLWAGAETGAQATVDGVFRNHQGVSFPVEAHLARVDHAGAPHLIALVRDTTERLIAEGELRQAQKLESVGRLAAGIAHEINTPIQFVGDNAHFIKDGFLAIADLLATYQRLHAAAAEGMVDDDLLAEVARAERDADVEYLLAEVPHALDQTLDGVDRVATIVRAMKDFAHPDQKDMVLADLNQGLLSTLTVARNELKYVAEVETQLSDIPPILCRPGDLNQVFLNLLVNAAHAIADAPNRDGEKGTILVQSAQAGDSVVVAISDTGCGIPEHVQPHIFDPFFTTKEVGRGTGQGLALARSIVVEQHGGNLHFESEIGHGTTFFVRLPIDGGANPEGGDPA